MVKDQTNTDEVKEETKTVVETVGNKEEHVCTVRSHEAMLECQVCALFCHASCVKDVGAMKMCGVCLSKKANGNGNGLPVAKETTSFHEENNLDEDEEEDEETEEQIEQSGCATSGANSKLNEVLSS